MNCSKENHDAFIAGKISGWREQALYGIDRYERARGRRNFKRLIAAYPDLAADLGVTAQLSFAK